MSVWTTLRFAFSPTGTSFLVVNDEGRFRLFDTGILYIALHSLGRILDRLQSLVLVSLQALEDCRWSLQFRQTISNVPVLTGRQLGRRCDPRHMNSSLKSYPVQDTFVQSECQYWLQTKHSPARQLIVVGNGAGELAAYNTALGEEVWRLADCHQGYASACPCAPHALFIAILMQFSRIGSSSSHALCCNTGHWRMMICCFVLSLTYMTMNITSDKLMPQPHAVIVCLATSIQLYCRTVLNQQ